MCRTAETVNEVEETKETWEEMWVPCLILNEMCFENVEACYVFICLWLMNYVQICWLFVLIIVLKHSMQNSTWFDKEMILDFRSDKNGNVDLKYAIEHKIWILVFEKCRRAQHGIWVWKMPFGLKLQFYAWKWNLVLDICY